MIKYAPTPLPAVGRPPATEEDLNSRRRMAQMLMQQGTDASPVGHWTQALARGLQGFSGGMATQQVAGEARDLAAFGEKASNARRMAERVAAMEDRKAWDEYQRTRTPTEAEKLDLDLKRAQIEKSRRDVADAGATYGKSGTVVQGADGKFYSIQFGNDGSRVILPLEVGQQPGQAPQPPQTALTPSRGVDVVGDQMYDKATGQPMRNVGGNLAEAERQKAVGKGKGEGQIGLGKAATALKDYEIKSGLVMGEIDRALSQASPWTTGFVGNLGSYIAGTPAHDLSKTLNGIQSNLGFDTLQQMRENSPTGGALGSVTERELELLQSTWGSLVQSQSEAQFRHNLLRLKQVKEEYAVLKRQAYERDVAMFGAANVPNPGGAPAVPPSAPNAIPNSYIDKYGLEQ